MVTCDADGFVRGFPYHDGFLDGVLAVDKEVHLALRAVTGERHVLTLRRVAALHVGGFREGNIVLTMRIRSTDRVDEAARRAVQDRLLLDLPEQAVLFELASSFGADVLAICHDVEVSAGSLAAS